MGETTIINISRLTALQRKLDVVANNVANMETTGYRARQLTFQEYLSASKENADPWTRKERPVSLVDAASAFASSSLGEIRPTGNPLDVAIHGDGYFIVQTEDGEALTRDGSFTLDADGRLVTKGGNPVLTDRGILTASARDGELSIGLDGSVSNKKEILGRIRLVNFSGAVQVSQIGRNLLRAPTQPLDIKPGATKLIAGALEKSNVQPALEMAQLVETTRSYELVSSLLKSSQDTNDINKLANVPE
ncbi:MAG: flagellar basal-body rod protein FlgF [Xanthobacteraceae bacterium]|nr:flagellar basal-body rod protein FlgF [Xanthobacteraceae bacterium]